MDFCWWIRRARARRLPCVKPVSAIARPFGAKPSGMSWLERKLREASADSTVGPELAREAACRPPKYSRRGSKIRPGPRRAMPRYSIRCVVQIGRSQEFQSFRKTCYLPLSPPPGTASRHFQIFSKSTGDCETKNCPAASSFVPPASLTPRSRACLPAVPLFKKTKRRGFALRNFDAELPYPYRYGLKLNDRLESVANAHTAADLHVRPGP